MPPLIIAAQMRPSSRLKDDSVTLKFVTQEEVDTTLFSLIDGYRTVNGWLYFSPDRASAADVPSGNAVASGDSTPSQKLRAALYALHMSRGGTNENWPVVYQRDMDKIIKKVTDSIEG